MPNLIPVTSPLHVLRYRHISNNIITNKLITSLLFFDHSIADAKPGEAGAYPPSCERSKQGGATESIK